MKQVHLVMNVNFGGGEQVLNYLSKKLPEKTKIYFLRKSNNINLSKNITYLTNVNAKNSYNFIDQIINLFLSLYILKKIIDIINNYDHIVMHGFPLQFLCSYISSINKQKQFHFVFHGIKRNNFIKKYTFAKLEKYLLNKENIKIYGVSDKLVNILKVYFNKRNINLFINCYEKINQKNIEIKNKYNNKTFLYVARFENVKRHDRLIELYKNKILDLEIKVLCIGDGSNLKSFQKKINENRLNKQIITLGAIDRKKLFKYYINCDGILFPSESEAFGIALLESIEFKLPVFYWNKPPIIFQNFYNINSLNTFLKNKNKFILSKKSFKKILNNYSSEKTYLSIY